MSQLVKYLCDGKHPVSAEQYKDAAGLKKAIDGGFVLIKFTGTRGGTELGFDLDRARSRLDAADFADPSGTVRLSGEVTLDYQPVWIDVDIELDSLQGEGRMQFLEEPPQDAPATASKSKSPAASGETVH